MQQAQAAPDGVKGNWRVLTSLALRSDDNSRALSALVLNVMIILKNQECTERLARGCYAVQQAGPRWNEGTNWKESRRCFAATRTRKGIGRNLVS